MMRPVEAVLRFFRSGPDLPPVSADSAEIRRRYELRRWSVFVSVTIGYGFFYVGRINLSVAKGPMLDAGVLDAREMGLVGSALLFVYAFGKLINGFLADRSNIRRFMSFALLGSAVVNLLLGATTSFWLFLALWGLNGWFQSVGSAPSVVSLSQWFTVRERGTRYGIWSTSHAIGGAITFVLTAQLVSRWGWTWGFLGPGLACLVAALVLVRTLADRPETYGLPPVHEYKGEPPPPEKKGSGIGTLQAEVLKNPAVWVLGLASAAMYVARYGMDNWGVLFLQKGKGYALTDAGSLLAISPIAQIVGSTISGWISDRFFASRRNTPALISGAVLMGALAMVWFVPPGNWILDAVAIALFGLGLGVMLVYLGGLMAVDIVSPRAAGAAMGLVGMFSYLGASIQDAVTGMLLKAGKTGAAGAEVYSFDSTFMFWLGASALSMALVVLLRFFSRSEQAADAPAAPAATGS